MRCGTPRSGTNPRGFGIERRAVEKLLEKSKTKGNHVSKTYSPIDITKAAEEYKNEYYELLKKLALKY